MRYVWNALAKIHVLQLPVHPQQLHPSQLCLCELTGLWQHGSKQHANQPWHRPPSKQVSIHNKAPMATSQGTRCVRSGAGYSPCVYVCAFQSNTTLANALVSRPVILWCWGAQLALWAAVKAQHEPTWTVELCIQIKGKLKATANFVTFLCVKVSTHFHEHKDRKNEAD